MTGSLLLHNLNLNCLVFSTCLNSSLIIFIRIYTVIYRNALNRLRVCMNIVLFAFHFTSTSSMFEVVTVKALDKLLTHLLTYLLTYLLYTSLLCNPWSLHDVLNMLAEKIINMSSTTDLHITVPLKSTVFADWPSSMTTKSISSSNVKFGAKTPILVKI